MVARFRRLMQLYSLLLVQDSLPALRWALGREWSARRRHVEDLISRVEVPAALHQEFLEWRACHPIPEEPLVSVCVATYNRARLLAERCVASVLSQSYERLELIVVGDGCSDDTAAVLAGITDPRLTFYNLPERGPYPSDPRRRWMVAGTPAMNAAMARARGHYITHLDDDDEYLPDRLEKLIAFTRSQGCDFVWHPFWVEGTGSPGTEEWILKEALKYERGQVTTSSVFYRSWFRKIEWDIEAHRLDEPGDWNRFRRIRSLRPVCMRFPEPLLKHYREAPERSRETSPAAGTSSVASQSR